MAISLRLTILSLQVLAMSASQNPMCDPKLTIDSAFVDIYWDSGEDIITLFSNQTVYQLTVSSQQNSHTYRLKQSQPLTEWAKGSPISGPIKYLFTNNFGESLVLGNEAKDKEWGLWSHNRSLYLESSFIQITGHQLYYDIDRSGHQSSYSTWDLTARPIHIQRYNSTKETGQRPPLGDQIDIAVPQDWTTADFLKHTSAGFVYKGYMYLISGDRICDINLITREIRDKCFDQSIGQWVGCYDSTSSIFKTSSLVLILICGFIVVCVILAVIVLYILFAKNSMGEKSSSNKQTLSKQMN